MAEACEKFGATFEHTVATSYLGYSHADDHPLVALIADAGRSMGLTPVCASSGGGSDANIYNQNGIVACNLGVGMEKVHTTAEQQSIAQMEQAATLCMKLMAR